MLKYDVLARWVCKLGLAGWLGCASQSNEPGPEAPSSRTEAPAAAVPGQQQPAQQELEAYERAKPVFETYCASCHTMRGKKSTEESLEHFKMDGYPFGGHHADEITEALREVLALSGSKKPSMPKDKPGAVQGEELQRIVAWADAYDQAHPTAAHEHHHEHTDSDSGHEKDAH